MADERIKVSLAYARIGEPNPQPILLALDVAPGTTIGQAIELSGILQEAPEINLVTMPVGIYGKKKTLDTVLQPRDRIEIYRPLIADPKDARRRRAKKADKPAEKPVEKPAETEAGGPVS